MGGMNLRIESMTDEIMGPSDEAGGVAWPPPPLKQKRSPPTPRRRGDDGRLVEMGFLLVLAAALGPRRRRFLAGPGQFLARLVGFALTVPHAGIKALLIEKLVMGAALDDGARRHDQYLIGIDDGRQAVRDDQCRASAR